MYIELPKLLALHMLIINGDTALNWIELCVLDRERERHQNVCYA